MGGVAPVHVVHGARTPFLKSRNLPGPFAASDLAAILGRALLARQPFAADQFDEVIVGWASPSADEVNIGRVAGQALDHVQADSRVLFAGPAQGLRQERQGLRAAPRACGWRRRHGRRHCGLVRAAQDRKAAAAGFAPCTGGPMAHLAQR